jgi:CRP-like cAMP-binding protein
VKELQPEAFSMRDRAPAFQQTQILGYNRCALSGSELCSIIRDEGTVTSRPPKIRRFARGEILVDQGDIPNFLGVLQCGYVRQQRLRLNGNHIPFGLACPGDVVGGVPGINAGCALEASTDIEILTFHNMTVEHLMLNSPTFRQFILRETGRQHQRLLGSAWRRNALDSRERIIAFLIDATGLMPTSLQPDGSLIVQIEVSRRDWADLTNTAVETVSRTMRYLAEKELVASLTPYKFHIRDLDQLAFLAGVKPPSQQKLRSDQLCLAKGFSVFPRSIKCETPQSVKVEILD